MKPTFVASVVAASILLLCADAALANGKMVSISGVHPREEIKGTCDKAGGSFHDLGADGYYCQSNTNQNGVVCDKGGKCQGIIYLTAQPKSPFNLGTLLTTTPAKLQSAPPKTQLWWDDTGTPDHDQPAPSAAPSPRPPRYLH